MALDQLVKYKDRVMKTNLILPMKKRKRIIPIIPLHVYMTWKTTQMPPLMHKNFVQLCKENPEFQFHLYDDTACSDFIKNHFPPEVLEAYDGLIPGAYKADLWRLCILYINGGIYMDIKLECIGGFRLYEVVDKEHYVLDRPKDTLHIYNAFMVSKAVSPFLKAGIYKIVQNVKQKYYGKWILSPTGPDMLGQIASHFPINIDMIYPIRFNDHIMYENHLVLRNYKGYRNEQLRVQKHYSELWYNKSIYV
jgi:mannosyltransferase OCH1-like enzyme